MILEFEMRRPIQRGPQLLMAAYRKRQEIRRHLFCDCLLSLPLASSFILLFRHATGGISTHLFQHKQQHSRNRLALQHLVGIADTSHLANLVTTGFSVFLLRHIHSWTTLSTACKPL